jgi:ribosomal protein S18 acetylase RimI-like enzyme
MLIRPYRPGDLADVYDVCVRTAGGGGDARGQYSTDDLMPDIFAGPYVQLEPEHAFVLDDGTRVVGYVIATSDSARFARRYRDEWIPSLGEKYRRPPTPATTAEDRTLALHFDPDRMVAAEVAAYPAHLHIDLLPESQGQGLGRRLIETLLDALAAEGVPGVHLVMASSNVKARAFYDRLGFTEVPVAGAEGVDYLVRRTAR